MNKISEDIVIEASPECVFALYEDVANWRRWDPDVASSLVTGPFSVGTTGRLMPSRGPEAVIQIVSVEKNRSFTIASRLPLCTMLFEHELAWEQGATRVTHRVSFSGPLSFFFARVVGRQIHKGLPGSLRGLKQAAEANDA